MGALQRQQPELLHLSSHFLSASAAAIRSASSPQEAFSLFRLRLRRLRCLPPSSDPFNSHAAVFTLKSISSSSSSTASLIPHLHAYLLKNNLLSNVHVSTSLLHAYSLHSPNHADLLFDEIPNPNLVTANTMLTSLCRTGRLNAAVSLFDAISDKDVVSWSAMIEGYMCHGRCTNGLALFREMMEIGEIKPDPQMLVTLLSGCTSVGSLQSLCKSIHAYAEKHWMQMNEQLATSLVDMYAKSGCLRNAFIIFERVPQRNVTHWTAMICGLAMHGHGEEAIAFFNKMLYLGMRPSVITFVGLLNACCQSGLIEEGQKFFYVMVEEFGFEPEIWHYGCMVDLLAKAGRLDDAYAIIRNMRIEPNIIVWTSFLAACKKHKNFEIAEEGIEKVLGMEISSDNGALYTLISDLYALGGRWDSVKRVRKLMDEKNVRKIKGSSFIEALSTRAL
ncbi:pentatricopeptide repeat-containing protein ELI1, chloroplastic-like [Typha angustifolia]|uniref:pentatricopeptide repeat-containing protein ELI1, chloroplastic-like n=1 Tax=Typha angustifolia TaxID=59011 RepID=UPI003C2C5653